ncbi:dihydrofolate reductase family protein [Mucilaginibacter koreensis]
MRKVILNLAVSLDGYIEGPGGEYDWCFTDQDYGMSEFFSEIDTIFLGRKSYELLITAEENPFPGIKKYVFSDTLPEVQHEEIEVIGKADFKQTVTELINQEGGHIWLFGGADLVSSFLAEKLISDFTLSIHPVLLGGGKPLFRPFQQRTELMHIDTITYPSGLVQLKYILKPHLDYDLLEDNYVHSNAF